MFVTGDHAIGASKTFLLNLTYNMDSEEFIFPSH